MTTTSGTPALTIKSPVDGHVVAQLATHTSAQVGQLAQALRAAQRPWAALGFDERARWLRRWRDWLLDNEERLVDLVQEETGKCRADAAMELPIAIEVINYYADNGGKWLAPHGVRRHSIMMATKNLRSTYQPYPLVGLITPWNGPIGNPMLDLPAALLAGCAVLSKPSEVTPVTWSEVIRGWREDLGAPPVVDVAVGGGDVGAAVVDEVDMVHFTGSVRTGRAIAMRCADRLIPVSLELGGKDAMIVLDDADVGLAASAAVWGAFLNSGQACISVERVYVEKGISPRFIAAVAEKAAKVRQGFDSDSRDIKFDVGAMATRAQVDIVEEHVRDARRRGARVLVGGKRGTTGLYFEPTVMVDVDHSMQCMYEETFGPTLPIMTVADEDEAIRLANDSRYGLSASVWSKDSARAERVAAQIDVGAVNVNAVLINLFQLGLIQGGWKESGIGGRLGGARGIRKYCREKTIVTERVPASGAMQWFPASSVKVTAMSGAIRFLGADDWRRRLGRQEQGRTLPPP